MRGGPCDCTRAEHERFARAGAPRIDVVEQIEPAPGWRDPYLVPAPEPDAR